MAKNILMICYYYPPLADVGCKRSIAFSKYFKKHGWNPYVLSVKNPDKSYCSLGKEKTPAGIPTDYAYSILNPYGILGKVNAIFSRILKYFGIRLKGNYFSDLLCIPDIFFGWIPLAVLRGYRIIRERGIHLIYVSCIPTSSAIIGVFLKALTGRPLVVDFRDPFALKHDRFFEKPKFQMWSNLFIEKFILKNTDIFITTTEETRKGYMRQYPEHQHKMFTIYNGFVPEHLMREPVKKWSKFTIIYVGNFYFDDPRNEAFTRSFFQAMSLLKARGIAGSSNFQFLFYGEGIRAIEDCAKASNVEDLIAVSSRIPYEEILHVVSKSHLQLLRIIKPMITTKFFEGISLNVPFLATIPSGEVEYLIRKYSPGSYIVTEASSESIANAILDAMSKYRNGLTKNNFVIDFLENFSRERQFLRLLAIIEGFQKQYDEISCRRTDFAKL